MARHGWDIELSIVSDEAYVAAAAIPAAGAGARWRSSAFTARAAPHRVRPLTEFAVVDVLAMDEALARQVAPWPGFRRIDGAGRDILRFANHCPHCGAEQDDQDLHTEPGEPFFDIPHAPPGALRLIPLTGQVRLSGDEHFTID